MTLRSQPETPLRTEKSHDVSTMRPPPNHIVRSVVLSRSAPNAPSHADEPRAEQ
jgi:hypothetical protein